MSTQKIITEGTMVQALQYYYEAIYLSGQCPKVLSVKPADTASMFLVECEAAQVLGAEGMPLFHGDGQGRRGSDV